MFNQNLNTTIIRYKELVQLEQLSKSKQYVIVGGNMTVNIINEEYKLFSSLYPTTFDEKSCDEFISIHNSGLIRFEKISYTNWLEHKIKIMTEWKRQH